MLKKARYHKRNNWNKRNKRTKRRQKNIVVIEEEDCREAWGAAADESRRKNLVNLFGKKV